MEIKNELGDDRRIFLKNQTGDNIGYYAEMLQVVGSLSRLFSEAHEPFIQYRVAENLFCKAFNADNLSRTDCSADATKGEIGIGIKTFLHNNGMTLQKVAEFNSEHALFRNLDVEAKILKVSELRNKRIETTKRIFGIDRMIYHCLTRKPGKVSVFEESMDLISVNNISKINQKKNTISFNDGLNEYSFNITKSTLYKRFLTEVSIIDVEVAILEDPFRALELMLSEGDVSFAQEEKRSEDYVYLPLYSTKGMEKFVSERSGLNQWNAGGRQRGLSEAYIPVPAWIHRRFPDFFPGRDQSFDLVLPNKQIMSAKVCQDNSKALMSNPNSSLGEWLLRDVLDLKDGELLIYEKLEEIGLDSVVVYKMPNGDFDIDFAKLGSYEDFKDQYSG